MLARTTGRAFALSSTIDPRFSGSRPSVLDLRLSTPGLRPSIPGPRPSVPGLRFSDLPASGPRIPRILDSRFPGSPTSSASSTPGFPYPRFPYPLSPPSPYRFLTPAFSDKI